MTSALAKPSVPVTGSRRPLSVATRRRRSSRERSGPIRSAGIPEAPSNASARRRGRLTGSSPATGLRPDAAGRLELLVERLGAVVGGEVEDQVEPLGAVVPRNGAADVEDRRAGQPEMGEQQRLATLEPGRAGRAVDRRTHVGDGQPLEAGTQSAATRSGTRAGRGSTIVCPNRRAIA